MPPGWLDHHRSANVLRPCQVNLVDRILLRSGSALQHYEGHSPHLPVLLDNLPFFRYGSFAAWINNGVFVSHFPIVAKHNPFLLAHNAPRFTSYYDILHRQLLKKPLYIKQRFAFVGCTTYN